MTGVRWRSSLAAAAILASSSVQPEPADPESASTIQMNRIAVVTTPAGDLLTAHRGIDLDRDGQREFVVVKGPLANQEITPMLFYECTGDNAFALVHVLDLENTAAGNDWYYPSDAGDLDGDGLSDLVVIAYDYLGFGLANKGVRIYESPSEDAFPTQLAWDDWRPDGGPWRGGRILDGDLDGKQEIAVTQMGLGADFAVYENDGDDSYPQIHFGRVGEPIGDGQSFEILSDFDGNGRDEVLYGEVNKITAFESTGDDAYAIKWMRTFNPSTNVQFIIDGGDLDGDGKNEFLAGGLKPNPPWFCELKIFEPDAAGEPVIVGTLTVPCSGDFYTSANVADVDGDGRREIVYATGSVVKIYENVGDNAWQVIWSGAGSSIQSIGAGDHDQDGKDEIIFSAGARSRTAGRGCGRSTRPFRRTWTATTRSTPSTTVPWTSTPARRTWTRTRLSSAAT